MKKLLFLIFILNIIIAVLAGCRPTTARTASAVDSAAVILPQEQETAVLPTPTLAQPVVIYNETAAPTNMPSFTLANPEDLTRQAVPTATETAVPPTPIPADTSTPQPTFTPPALPFTSQEEHYWFRRPIPEGGTVWTDKVYPYGGTKGGTLRPHHGVEFYVPTGTQVLSAASGTVRVAGNDSAVAYGPHTNFYGNLVIIEHDSQLDGQPLFTLYGHLSDIFVAEGQPVESQQPIAFSGATGVADGPHLHFEVRLGNNSYAATRNPLLWLYPFPDRGTVVGQVTWPDGNPVHEAPVRLNRVDAASRYLATTTYAAGDVNADGAWNENFAIDDVDAGYYEVIVETEDKKYKAEVWVFPYRTSFVEIVIDP